MSNIDKIRHYLKVIRRACDLVDELLEEDEYDGIDEMLREIPARTRRPARREVVVEHDVEEIEPESVKRMPEKVVIAEVKADIPEESIAEFKQGKDEPEIEPQVKTVKPPKKLPKPEEDPHFAARQKHIKDLLSIDVWPVAVEEHLQAAATSEDQINRANAMLDMLVNRPIEGVSFLDFGCGEGWMAKQALDRGAEMSVGYDLIPSDSWNKHKNVQFTNVFKEVAENQYDMVMLYDVLDHCQDPEDVMRQVRSVVKPGGAVYIRNHPWTAKHASHLYKNGLNKAYIHLFLTWEELVEQGYSPEFTRQEINPFPAYRWWFDSSNFDVENEAFRRNPVNEFFFSGDFKELIRNEQQIDPSEIERFFSDMEVEFVDYVLVPK